MGCNVRRVLVCMHRLALGLDGRSLVELSPSLTACLIGQWIPSGGVQQVGCWPTRLDRS